MSDSSVSAVGRTAAHTHQQLWCAAGDNDGVAQTHEAGLYRRPQNELTPNLQSKCAAACGGMVISNSARTSARRSAKEGASDAPYRVAVGRVEYQKRFRTPWELTQEPSPGRAMSLVHLRYPTAQCARSKRDAQTRRHRQQGSKGARQRATSRALNVVNGQRQRIACTLRDLKKLPCPPLRSRFRGKEIQGKPSSCFTDRQLICLADVRCCPRAMRLLAVRPL